MFQAIDRAKMGYRADTLSTDVRGRLLNLPSILCPPATGLSWVAAALLAGVMSACSAGAATSSPTATPTNPTPVPTLRATSSKGTGGPPNVAIDTLQERAIAAVSPAIVKVTNVNVGLGSGVIIRSDGYIVTNNHVVANAQRIEVTLPNGHTLGARLVGADATDDLAVLKIGQAGLPTATFGDSSKLIVGETVLAIGNPLGIVRTATSGIVSALNRTVTEGQGTGSIRNAVQTSAPINPGNSGGALIDLAGHVIGIPTLTAVDPEFNAPASGIGFAIPSNTVVNISSQIITYGRVVHSGRAALGISAESVTPTLAAQFGLPIDHGVLVAQVVSGGGAQQAGIGKNDIIVGVGSQSIGSLDDLVKALAQKNPGQTVSVTVVTPSGSRKTYEVKLGELPVSGNG